jgi:2-polyprenyl-6-methoxyphenol hydroxylase-like FAD-dependent oxidoreductase
MAGLSAALVLGRAGHDVVLLDRDSVFRKCSWEESLLDKREGVAHFFQPHVFWPRGRTLFKEAFPDVYQSLLEAGAFELHLHRNILGETQPADEELIYVGVRRALIDWALLQAVMRAPSIRTHGGVRIAGLLGRPGRLPDVTGVRTSEGQVQGDLVVDALGRSSPAFSWLQALGAAAPQMESSPCGQIYYSRYFQLKPDAEVPTRGWLISPRGDLGYGGFMTFIADNRTFAIVLSIPTLDADLKVLQHEPAFMAACRHIPAIAGLVDPAFAEPISPIRPMGGLSNTRCQYVRNECPIALGLLPVGDSLCHTNPVYALGLSFSLVHSLELCEVLRMDPAADREELALQYFARIAPELNERYTLAGALDAIRIRVWQGERVDFMHRHGCYPWFTFAGAAAVALDDPGVCRKTLRRMGMLDRLSVFDEDVTLQERVEELLARKFAEGPPRQGPSRAELVRIVTESVAQKSATS